MNKLEELKEKIKNSKISEVKKRRIISALVALSLLFSLSGCNKDKDDKDQIIATYSMMECLDMVSSLTLLDEYLVKNNFQELNEQYVEARKNEDLNSISKLLPNIYNLILEGTVIDYLAKEGKINSVDDVKNIKLAFYNDKKLSCDVEYVTENSFEAPGNINYVKPGTEILRIEFSDSVKNDYRSVNDLNNISLEKADEKYFASLKNVFNKGGKTIYNKFTLKNDEDKFRCLDNSAETTEKETTKVLTKK